ncbi:MAG: SpoIIIAH-like family protein [Bacillota bacterium]|nr:SpoIIIAH-like family protein [Bacillota bacterium]MDP4160887.1 SpoIIIAH-like family protein [Bacillota bacterium]
MFNGKLQLPFIVFIKRKWIWLGGLVGFALIVGTLALWTMRPEVHTHFIGQPSLPVNGTVESPSIQFQVETVQPNVSGEDYFVNYRLKRDQFRQETKAMLSELLNSTVAKSREQAQEKWLELSLKQQKEGEIENLLKIKGFQDAVADVFQENVTVIVCAPSLTPNEVSRIQDIVVRVTKVRIDKIAISAKK